MATESTNKYISVSYKLYGQGEGQEPELIEEATGERPFEFLTGLGMTLDDFERQIEALETGAPFDFTLGVEQAYGPYDPEGRREVPRSMFEIDGKIDPRYIHEGAVVPLQSSDGQRFSGLIALIQDDTVTVDLNHPLAGKTLRFVGKVEQSRPATDQEVSDALQALSGEGGCCGCEGCGGEGNCSCGCEGDNSCGCESGSCGCEPGERGCEPGERAQGRAGHH